MRRCHYCTHQAHGDVDDGTIPTRAVTAAANELDLADAPTALPPISSRWPLPQSQPARSNHMDLDEPDPPGVTVGASGTPSPDPGRFTGMRGCGGVVDVAPRTPETRWAPGYRRDPRPSPAAAWL
jgi:hypothetical protein